jgi:hypothetical protein
MPMRTRVAALVVLVAALAATGCAPADRPMSRAQARAVARAIDLTEADLPGAKRFRYTVRAQERRELERNDRCVGIAPRREQLADHVDLLVTPDGTSVSSQVRVMRSTAVATHDMAALGSRRAAACFTRQGAAGTARMSVRALRSPVGPGPGTRIDIRDHFHGQPVHFVADVLSFQTGPTEVTLLVAASNRAPAALERRLLATLIHRAGQAVP